jgi:hypothetical protein
MLRYLTIFTNPQQEPCPPHTYTDIYTHVFLCRPNYLLLRGTKLLSIKATLKLS